MTTKVLKEEFKSSLSFMKTSDFVKVLYIVYKNKYKSIQKQKIFILYIPFHTEIHKKE